MNFNLKIDNSKECFYDALGLYAKEAKQIEEFVDHLIVVSEFVSKNIESIIKKYSDSLEKLVYAIYVYGMKMGFMRTIETHGMAALRFVGDLIKAIKMLDKELN